MLWAVQTKILLLKTSGNGADEVKKPTWPYFDSVSFLNESLTAN